LAKRFDNRGGLKPVQNNTNLTGGGKKGGVRGLAREYVKGEGRGQNMFAAM